MIRFKSRMESLAMLLTTNAKPNRKRPNKQIVEFVSRIKTGSDALIMNPDWYETTFLYYSDINTFKDYIYARKKLNIQGVFPLKSFLDINTINLDRYRRVIYLQVNNELGDPQNLIARSLEKKLKFAGTFKVYNCQITIYYQTPA